MKLNELLNEDIGTLAQLGLGPLVNLLKQHSYSSRRSGTQMGPIEKRFARSYYIGSTSEIVDIGAIKSILKSIKKAFKSREDTTPAQAFAIYLGGKPVLFAVTDLYKLSGSSRSNDVAYDFTPYSDIIDQMYQGKYDKPRTTSIRQQEPRYSETKPRLYAGDVYNTGSLSELLTIIEKISVETDQQITAKIVLTDVTAREKRHKRQINRDEILKNARDLRTRLAIYKNTKRPTVDTIEDFISMSLKNPGKTVRFQGYTYKLTGKSLDRVNPFDLLSGKAFRTYYSAIDPDSNFENVDIYYRYEPENNQLVPIQAEWVNRENKQRQYAILDKSGYFKNLFNTKTLDKKAIISKLIADFDNAGDNSYQLKRLLRTISDLKTHGYDWTELDVLAQTVQSHLAGKSD